ncbi:hypothetical protein [Mesorhizobium sp. 128a]
MVSTIRVAYSETLPDLIVRVADSHPEMSEDEVLERVLAELDRNEKLSHEALHLGAMAVLKEVAAED